MDYGARLRPHVFSLRAVSRGRQRMPGGPGAERRSGPRGAAAWPCLDVNGTQPGPTTAKAAGPKRAPGYGSGCVALGLVASFFGLITQRSLVQIRPPLLCERVLELEILEPFFLPMSPWLFHQACFGSPPGKPTSRVL